MTAMTASARNPSMSARCFIPLVQNGCFPVVASFFDFVECELPRDDCAWPSWINRRLKTFGLSSGLLPGGVRYDTRLCVFVKPVQSIPSCNASERDDPPTLTIRFPVGIIQF